MYKGKYKKFKLYFICNDNIFCLMIKYMQAITFIFKSLYYFILNLVLLQFNSLVQKLTYVSNIHFSYQHENILIC